MSGWSDAEKVQLLFAIIEAHSPGPIKWKDVAIPEGRTIKACTHIIAKMKAEIGTGATGSLKKSPAKATPTKSMAKSPTKRKKVGEVHVYADQSDEEDMMDVPSPSKRNRKTAPKDEIQYEDDTVVKQEASEIGEVA